MSEPERVTPKPAAGFLSLPASRIGKWSAWLLVASLTLVLLNNLVVMPQTEQNTDLELAQRIFNLCVFFCVVAAGLTGLLAVVIKRERSWVLFVSILFHRQELPDYEPEEAKIQIALEELPKIPA